MLAGVRTPTGLQRLGSVAALFVGRAGRAGPGGGVRPGRAASSAGPAACKLDGTWRDRGLHATAGGKASEREKSRDAPSGARGGAPPADCDGPCARRVCFAARIPLESIRQSRYKAVTARPASARNPRPKRWEPHPPVRGKLLRIRESK